MAQLSLYLLGPFAASLGREPLSDFRTRKVQALLIYLAAEPEAHSRDNLLNLFWPGLPEKSARSNLRQILYYLRQIVPEVGDGNRPDTPVLIANRQEIQLNPQADVQVDTRQFVGHLDHSQAHEHLDIFLCRECAAELDQAVSLYRGDFLADFYLDDSNEFEAWAYARREYFRRRVLDALGILTTMAQRSGEYAAAQSYAEQQLEIDNLRESAYRQLMEVLALHGRREQALAVYETCRRVLAEELGMAPTKRTTELYEQIRAGDLQLGRTTRPGVRGYELQEEIGEGAYGTIYRAIQPAIQREVAVKVIRRQYADDPEFIRRFEGEAQLVARLEHPYIVPLYDYWRDPEGAYLAMRYLRGGSLLAELKSGPWNLARTAGMLEQIAGALAVAHQQGVVHRDIKPGNILLDEVGNAYLADFGIAKDLGRERELTAEGAVVGTLDYASPEQILSDEVTAQADIYSLGAVLYETLTGEKPFSDISIAKLLYSHLNEPIPLVTATRPDVPEEIDLVLQKATAKQPAERYATVLEMAAAFRQAVQPEEAPADGREWEPVISPAEVYNPYKGLQAFQEADVDDFFGREALVQQLVQRLGPPANGHEHRFLAVVGPSGSGKSSVVKAGLIPALREGALPGSDKWFITEMVPGTNPLEELELALWRVAVDPPPDLVTPMQRDTGGMMRTLRRILPMEQGHPAQGPQLLLVIDQFEELFTLVEDENQRTFFLDSLLAALNAPRSPLRVLVTLRADFYDRPLQYPEWGQLLKDHTEIVLPLNRTELTWAIREPARRMGVRLEEGLAATMVHDIADQPGALPLLQYALTELFERREERRISRSVYEQLGGVQGALGKRAEAIFNELDAEGQEAARQLFLRLITLGEGAEDTRRRVLLAEIESISAEKRVNDPGLRSPVSGQQNGQPTTMNHVLNVFGSARFLTFDHDPLTRAPTVEVAHEALLREWPRLKSWLADSRNDVRMQRMLAQAADEWRLAGRDPGYLLRDARLDQFAGWVAGSSVALTGREQDFITASLHAREQRLAAEEERRQKELETAQQLAATEKARAEAESRRAAEQTRSAGRLRWLAAGLAVVLLLAIGAAWLAINRGQAAQSSADLAATREAEALAEADQRATAQAVADEQRVAAEAARATAVEEGVRADEQRDSALSAQADAEEARQTADSERQQAEEQALLATSREFALAANLALETDPELSILLALEALETTHTEQAEEALHLGLQNSHLVARLPGNRAVYSPDGARLATLDWDSGDVRIWDASTFEELMTLEPFGAGVDLEFAGARSDVMFDVQGERIATYLGAQDYESIVISTWDAATGQALAQQTLPGTNYIWAWSALSPDLAWHAVGHEDGSVDLYDVGEGELLITFPGHDNWAWDVKFSPDGQMLLTNTPGTEVDVWDIPASLSAGQAVAVASFDAGGDIWTTSFSADGSQVLASLRGDRVEVWDIADTTAPQFTFAGIVEAFSDDGSLYAGPNSNNPVIPIYDGESGELLFSLAGHKDPVWYHVDFSPDGTRLASGSFNGEVRIWDVRRAVGGEWLAFKTEGAVFLDVGITPDGRLVALGNRFGPAEIRDAATGTVLRELAGEPETGVYAVEFSPDGARVATAGEDGYARVWDVQTGELQLEFLAHLGGDISGGFFGAMDVAFSPDGRWLGTTGTNGLAKIWDADTGAELTVFSGHTAGLWPLAFSPDGSMVATGSEGRDGSVRVWDPATGAEIHSLVGHSGGIVELDFSPDNEILLTAGNSGEVKAWDMATGAELYTLPDQGGTVVGVAFSPDGSFFTAGRESTKLWDTKTGEEIVTLAPVGANVAFSPDGTKLYASNFIDTIRVLSVPLDVTVALARERLTRSLTDEECIQYLHLEAGCPGE